MRSKKTLEYGRADREHDNGVQFSAGGNVTLHEVLERSVVDSTGNIANDTQLKKEENTFAQRKHLAPTVMVFSSGLVRLQRKSASIRVVLERSVVESAGLFANETWLEQYIDAMKAFSADRDDVSVCELTDLLVCKLI